MLMGFEDVDNRDRRGHDDSARVAVTSPLRRATSLFRRHTWQAAPDDAADVLRRVDCSGRDEEDVAGLERDGRLATYVVEKGKSLVVVVK